MTIRHKLGLIVALQLLAALIAVGALGWLAYAESGAQREEGAWRAIGRQVLDLTLLGHDVADHPDVARARAQWQDKHDHIARLLTATDAQDPLDEPARRLRREHAAVGELYRRLTDSPPPAVDPALREERRQRLAAQMATGAQSMVSISATLADEARARQEALRQRLWLAMVWVSIAVAALVAAIAVAAARTLLEPLRRLQQGTEAIGRGELDYRIGLTGRDEFADLGRAFDAMAERLDTVLASRALLEQEMEQRRRSEAALREAGERLTASNRELQEFAYVVSHDLQEPLRMVSSYLKLIARRYQGRLDQDADEFIAFAVDGAERMAAMIDGLLQYSRVQSRGEPFAAVDLEQVLADVLDNLRLQIEESGARVEHTRLPAVAADRQQMTRLLQNLIGNAIKFHGEAPPHVRVDARLHEGAWTLSVQDNGIGIEPRDAERVFGMFQRLHSRGKYPGTGIGLAVCKRIVERHGGRIWMESTPGGGSTFSFTLPQRQEDTP